MTNASQQDDSPLARAVTLALSDPGLPASGFAVQAIIARAADPEASVSEFALHILRDVALTLRVLRVANSALYNRSGKPVLSVSHAVALLGLDTVMHIATAIRLLEHFARKGPSMHGLLAICVLTAGQARRVAIGARYAKPEEAYLCGLLRNIGEVLTAYVMPRQYAETLVRVNQGQSAQGDTSTEILGFRYEQIAARVLRHWGLAGGVISCLDAGLESTADDLTEEGDLLKLITEFSRQSVSAVFREDPAASKEKLQALVQRYGGRLALGDAAIPDLLAGAVDDAAETFRHLGVALDALTMQRQVTAAAEFLDGERRRLAEEAARNSWPPAAGRETAALAEIEAAISSGEDFDLTSLILLVLELVLKTGVFDRCLFALLDADRKTIRGRLGLGRDAAALVEKFVFPLAAECAPVGHALFHRQEFHVDMTRDRRFRESPLALLAEPAEFALLPVVVDGVPVGLLYADRRSPSPAGDQAARAALRQMRDLIAAAIGKKRAAAQ